MIRGFGFDRFGRGQGGGWIAEMFDGILAGLRVYLCNSIWLRAKSLMIRVAGASRHQFLLPVRARRPR
jgi:hypothetical protein